ncbi:MAG: AMP-binding protein [Rikenellaceae bacterium]
MLKENLIKIYEESFRKNSDLPALSDYFKSDSFTYLEMAREIAKIHLLFDQIGIKSGDKIALIGRNNPRWCISYLATITYGATIVPILQDFNPNDVVNIINHSESRMIFLGDNFWDLMEDDRIPMIEVAVSLTDFKIIFERGEESDYTGFQKSINEKLAEKYPNGYNVDDIKYAEVPNEAPCLLNYTSGTTGSSKGVILTVNNLTGNVTIVWDYINVNTGEPYFMREGRVLSFLPLAHAYGCTIDFLAQLSVGAHITLLGKIPTPKILLEAMAKVKPTLICCVPLILEKIYRRQIMPLLEQGAMSIVMKIPLLNTAIYSVIKNKLIDVFGGQVGMFIVGGAPMNHETETFLMKIGFPITVGYGMTECAPLISFTPFNEFKAGSCGMALTKNLEVKIDSRDPESVPGEILVRGEHVMSGYYKNDKATKEVLDKEGWLHTGDMGIMDPDTTLYIKGRCKTMILSANGQNIYPEQIEDKLNNMFLVVESLIIDNDGRLGALVVPDYELARTSGISNEEIVAIMEKNLKELNTQVSNFEKVASITIYPVEFEKTPKKSIKRYLYSPQLLTTLN